jgi:uncharacterized protein
MFTIELSVTEKCNLGCPYCYVANKASFMTKEIYDKGMDDLTNFLERSGHAEYQLSYFGGEPMLNWDLIEYSVPKLKADPRCKGIVLISNLTMIDEEKAKFLKDNDIGVSWSFDGMSSNETRPLLPVLENKKSDSDDLYKDILEMYEDKREYITDLVNGCKFMVWPGNVGEMVQNFDFFIDWGVPNPDYSIVRDDVWTKDDIIFFRQETIKLADSWINKMKSGTRCSVGFLLLAILDSTMGIAKGKRPFGCFAGCSGAVLTSKGEFYPCQRFATKKMMKMDEDYDFKYWGEQFKPENYDKCKGCSLELVCNAGCSFSQLRNDNKPLDSVCELFHIIYEQALRVTDECKNLPVFKELVLNAFNNIEKKNGVSIDG